MIVGALELVTLEPLVNLTRMILFRGNTESLIRIDLRNNNSRSGQNNSWIWPFRKEKNREMGVSWRRDIGLEKVDLRLWCFEG